MRAVRGEALQVLEPSPRLRSRGARGGHGEHRPSSLPPCSCCDPRTWFLGSPMSIYVLRPRKIRKERKMERMKRKWDTAPILLRLRDLSVSMWKNSFFCTIKREKAYFSVCAVREHFWYGTQILGVKKRHFALKLNIFLIHFSSSFKF